ncbi:MAG: alpha-glucan family phosphorylase [Gammaproteobacteria bacterium]|nr:alpha-glucan family phosphorylase [Gammaproteobacteria bacterium]
MNSARLATILHSSKRMPNMPGTTFSLELRPNIPPALARLEQIACDLMYSWDRDIRGVFWRLDYELWRACGNNPKLFLRRVAQSTLEAASRDPDFLEDYNRALSAYDSYHAAGTRHEVLEHLDPAKDLVAYFCAEFGLHESLQIYSGGLGILAGDHCKAASDLGVPFVAIGLLYRQGYFQQRIDGLGRQNALNVRTNFDELPVSPVMAADGSELLIQVSIADREVSLRLWRAQVGQIDLYLLDSDVPDNSEEDRQITYQLYGGNSDTRIQQEIVLGVGGARAVQALGLKPTVWHINEGHAAFLILERVREHVQAGFDFETALELVASGTVFTTHTPVPAGHDIFNHAQLKWFFQRMLPQLGASEDQLMALGADPHGANRFNMTSLALRGSRFHNGVSRIHGGVASSMERYVYPEVPPEDNPISYVTNGVHLFSFLGRAWSQLFHDQFRGWRKEILSTEYWNRIDDIPDHLFISIRQRLKRDLFEDVLERVERQHQRNGMSEHVIAEATRSLRTMDTNMLVFGFARRFATYKRATLILSDPARLSRMLNNPERPAILIFAGKAHPSDQPGQALIRTIYEMSLKPEFIGRLFMVEGYDIALARNLVQGCDVWLNNPEYPLEASGTSGQKAGINGALNVSVLDGWWAEGYDGSNGFAVEPVSDPNVRDAEEARQMLDILERQVQPLYYSAPGVGYAPKWLRLSRNAMKTLIPRFNSGRQVMDYVSGFYGPAARQAARLSADGSAIARELSAWKQRVRERWSGVSLQLLEVPPSTLSAGQTLPLRIAAQLNGLSPDDVAVECVIGRLDGSQRFLPKSSLMMTAQAEGDRYVYAIDLEPLAGLQHYRLRAYPSHSALAHRFGMGLMIWL